MINTPHILLVNPWIHDFAAYDFWAKPYGLMTLASLLRSHGLQVSYVDCLDRFHPRAAVSDSGVGDGRGPYLKTSLPKPGGLEDVPRNYSRYGILPAWFREDLDRLTPPDLIFVTSLMTYWYPGVRETVVELKEAFPRAPVVLGGVYATLCTDHAKQTPGIDRVVTGPGEAVVMDIVREFTGFSGLAEFDPDDLDTYPYPAFDLCRKLAYVPLMTSRGCPFNCAYCASRFLDARSMRRTPAGVVEEVLYWHRKFGVRNVALYDDAFLIDGEIHALPILEEIGRANLPVRFHTPNALHIRGVTRETARLMFQAGFQTLRLGLETAAFDGRDDMDRKVTLAEFERAVWELRNAGFQKGQIGAYLLCGLPDQDDTVLIDSIRIVKASGVTPILAHYSPIPHTRLWEKAVSVSRYDLTGDPIFTNNAVAPCQGEPFSWEKMSRLKQLVLD